MIQVETTSVVVNYEDIIDQGNFGSLFKGKINQGKWVAVKIQKDITEFENQILLAIKGKQFDHIIEVIAFEKKEKATYTIMELGEKFDLRKISNKTRACLQVIISIFQMAKGVSELHKLGFFHLDLKPANFVMGKDNKIKLIDFGISKTMDDKIQTKQIGSFKYMAPEILESSNYDSSVDIWSLGMVFYQAFLGCGFFFQMNEYDIMKALPLINQKQINDKLRGNKNLEQWQQKLLQKMIVQRLDQEGKLNKEVKRISIDKVIHKLEGQDDYKQKLDLYEVLQKLVEIDQGILISIIDKLKKEKIYDCFDFIKKNSNDQNCLQIANILNNLSHLDFYKQNYSTENYDFIRKGLIKQISYDQHIIEFLKFLVRLTAIDERFIQSGSNALNLLVEMKADLREQSFENIRIRNTSLVGGNFVRCIFNGSEFDNVDISGMNLNQAQLLNCKWKNIKIHELNKLEGHVESVNQVCFSPDGKSLASCSDDNLIILWDVKTGKIKSRIKVRKEVKSVCFSPKASTLAFSSGEFVYLWNLKTGKQEAKLDGHSNKVNSICYSPDGTTLASGSSDKSIRLWDVKTGQQKAKLDGHSSAVNSICYFPDGSKLASSSYDNSIRLWDVTTGQQKAKLDGHSSTITSICFSPDGTTLASVSWNKSIRLWDVKTKQQKAKLDGHSSTVTSICFSPDGTTLASGSADKSIRLWDVKTGQKQAKLDGHSSTVTSICFSPDGTTLASGSADKSIRLWDVKTGQQKAKLDGHSSTVTSICFSPDGTTLASGSADKSIRLWDANTGQQKAKLDGHSSAVNSICYSPDGSKLASSSYDNSIRLWDVTTRQQQAKWDDPTDTVLTICYSPDGTTLAAGGGGVSYFGSEVCQIRLLKIKTRKYSAIYGHSYEVRSMNFSPDGTTLASGCSDNSIRLWDVKTGQYQAKLDGHSDIVNSICYSPQGSTLASGSNDNSIRLWDVKTGQQKAKLDGHSLTVYSICYSPDGITLASGSLDNSIRLWDVKTGQQKAKLDGHSSAVYSICYSPDGTTLASGSSDKSIRLWDVKTGQQIAKSDGYSSEVYSNCYSPDVTTLASDNDDNSTRFWNVKTAQEILPQDNYYKDLLSQFKLPLQYHSIFLNSVIDRTILRICQNPNLEASNALILKGDFENYQGKDLKPLFKSKGILIFEHLKQ